MWPFRICLTGVVTFRLPLIWFLESYRPNFLSELTEPMNTWVWPYIWPSTEHSPKICSLIGWLAELANTWSSFFSNVRTKIWPSLRTLIGWLAEFISADKTLQIWMVSNGERFLLFVYVLIQTQIPRVHMTSYIDITLDKFYLFLQSLFRHQQVCRP